MPSGVYIRSKEYCEEISRKRKGICFNTGRTHFKKGDIRLIGNKFNIGRISWNKGKRFPQWSGINSPRYGKSHTLEVRNKLRLSHLGYKMPEEQKKKISLAQIKRVKDGRSNFYIDGRSSKENRREYKRYKNMQRSLLKRNICGFHSLGEWLNLKAQYNWTCPNCGEKEPDIRLSEDHIIPISKGGSNNIENIQPLCRSCNSKKNNKIIIKYMLEEFNINKEVCHNSP